MEKNTLDRPLGLMHSELKVLRRLAFEASAKNALEVGMALGSSSEVLLEAVAATDGSLTSIDPFQLVAKPAGFAGEGVARVRALGYAGRHALVADYDYLALPDLYRAGRRFDFIFIDGYHSFDYTLLDFFYSDLLMTPGATLVLHDSSSAAVFKVCEFIANNKAYSRIGPAPRRRLDGLLPRASRRLFELVTGSAAGSRLRREEWKSLAAFRKVADGMAEEFVVRGL